MVNRYVCVWHQQKYSKLRMEINTKYNIGDAVYILDGYKIVRARIHCVKFEQHGEATPCITYWFPIYPMKHENECFTTKEELIKHLSK